MSTFNFTTTENTRVYKNHYGWNAETRMTVNGKAWVLDTMKRYSGKIATHCHVVQDMGDGNFSFEMFGRNKSEDFWLNELPKGTKATENTIRQAHLKALAEFDAKKEAGELPNAAAEYKIEVGQVIFTDHPMGSMDASRRAIYEIENTKWGIKYKTVHLDGSKTSTDDRIKNYKDKFGIGVYYNEGEKISQEEINDLLITAAQEMQMTAALEEAKEIEARKAAEEKKAYLSQFTQADRRTTTNIIKRHILKTWPQVQKVEVKTDVFSMGDSMDVYYHAPEAIPELEAFVDSFRYGSFNGMEDIYEHKEGYQAPILEGHILVDYKYTSSYYRECEAPEVTPQPETAAPVNSSGLQYVDYSEKAFAIIGDTKPIKDQLKELGGRFNFRLTCGAGWIFSKRDEAKVKAALGL